MPRVHDEPTPRTTHPEGERSATVHYLGRQLLVTWSQGKIDNCRTAAASKERLRRQEKSMPTMPTRFSTVAQEL